jgi:hypothetical protein
MSTCYQPLCSIPLSLALLLLTGCSAGRPSSVPETAKSALEKSTIYIHNTRTGKVIYTADLQPGWKLLFYPQQNRIILNGTVVKEGGLDPDHVHRLYVLQG